jgi:hypothetical protein
MPSTGGLPAIETLNFEQEMVRVINGYNLHLRGVALRIRALQAKERRENIEVVQSLLESSEADLLRTGDPVEWPRRAPRWPGFI